jgi:hypothetical protein
VRIYCWDYNEGQSCGGYRSGKRMALALLLILFEKAKRHSRRPASSCQAKIDR